jgi:hypothetical protein
MLLAIEAYRSGITPTYVAGFRGRGFLPPQQGCRLVLVERRADVGRLLSSLHGSSVATSCGEQIAAPAIRAKGV